jgi:hypothetical protein
MSTPRFFVGSNFAVAWEEIRDFDIAEEPRKDGRYEVTITLKRPSFFTPACVCFSIADKAALLKQLSEVTL